MRLLSLEDALETYLQQPTPARFAALRDMVVDLESYSPSPLVIAELTKLLDAGQHHEVLNRVDDLMPAWAICPRVHFIAGAAAEALGDFEEVELRRFLTTSCLEGIRNSGQGTRQRPWLATYPSDLQDCLRSLGLTATSQQLIDAGEAVLDVISANNGRQYFFNVTAMVAAIGEAATAEVAAVRS